MSYKSFVLRIEATSPEEGERILRKIYGKSHGERKNAGTIFNCETGQCRGEFPRYLIYNESKASAIIKQLGGGSEGVVDFIDLGHTRWRIRHKIKTTKRYTAKTEMRYAVCGEDGEILEPMEDHLFLAKTPADKKAEDVMDAGIVDVARVFRTQVVLSGNQEMTVLEWSEPQYRKTKEKPTRGITSDTRVDSMHQYVFFGKAPI